MAKVVSGLDNAGLIRQTGFAGVVEIDRWQAVPLGAGLTLHGVPMQHWSSRTRSDTNRTLWLGFIIDSPDGPLLSLGDTGLGPELGLINQRFGAIHLVALSIDAYEPRWFMRDHHMNPDDAMQARHTLQAQTSMAIHSGTFSLTDEQQDDPPKALQTALRSQGADPVTFGTPKPGEQWRVALHNIVQEIEITRREQQLRQRLPLPHGQTWLLRSLRASQPSRHAAIPARRSRASSSRSARASWRRKSK